MSRIGLGSQVMVRFGFSFSRDGQPLAGFEQLAMPLFDSLYNFARWLARDSNDAEDLVQETYLKALRRFRVISARHQFSRVDVPDPEEHFLSSRSKLEWRMTIELDSDEDCPPLASSMRKRSRKHSN